MLVMTLLLVPAVKAQNAGQQAGGYRQWQQLLADLLEYPEQEQVDAVNRFVNAGRNRKDSELWGEEDYWASPREFFARGAGDCEDFAVAKYLGLRRLGIPESRLRLGQGRVYDRHSGAIEAHLVLIYEDRQGREWILDNLEPSIERRSRRVDIMIDYVFNSEQLWLVDRAGNIQARIEPEYHEKWLAFMRRLAITPGRGHAS